MTKTERTELRRKFLVYLMKFVLNNKQFDTLGYFVLPINRPSDSFVTIQIVKNLVWSEVTWDIREILRIKNWGKLIQCRLESALWSIQTFIEENDK